LRATPGRADGWFGRADEFAVVLWTAITNLDLDPERCNERQQDIAAV
jgi:hypothetical protein